MSAKGTAALLLSVALLSSVPATFAEQPAGRGILRWRNGDELAGTLVGATQSHLQWHSPSFKVPLSISIDHLRAVEFERPEEVSGPREQWRFMTRQGDVLHGRPISIDQDHLVLESERLGRVALNRSAIYSVERVEGARLVNVEPAAAAWTTLHRSRQFSDWRRGEQGELSTTTVGAELMRDLELPAIAEVEIALRWNKEPSFLITFLPSDASSVPQDVVKLETWGGHLVLQTLASNGDFAQILLLAQRPDHLRLRLLWNQQQGELAVFTEYGRLLGKIATHADPNRKYTAIYIENKGAELSLTHLLVRPRQVLGKTDGNRGRYGLLLKDGELLTGHALSLDENAPILEIGLSSGQGRQIALDQIAGIQFGGSLDAEESPPAQLTFADGTQIGGTIHSAGDGRIGMKTSYSDELLTANLAGAMALRLASREPLPTLDVTDDVLEVNGLRLHGSLAMPEGEKGLGWRPPGSTNAIGLVTSLPMRIVRKGAPDAGQRLFEANTDVLYLRDGDCFPCRVQSIDEKHIHLQSPLTSQTRLPIEQVKAIELHTDLSLVTDFRDNRWEFPQVEGDGFERHDDKLAFRTSTTIYHPDLLRSNQLEFDLHWTPQLRASLTLQLYSEQMGRESPASILLYCAQQHLYVGQGGRHLRQISTAEQAKEHIKAHISVAVKNNMLRVTVDGREALAERLPDRPRRTFGISFIVQYMSHKGRARNGLINFANPEQNDPLIIANLRAVRVDERRGAQIDEQEKEVALTLPRHRKESPPTHILVALNGDLLRGRLVQMTEKHVEFISRMQQFSFPRERLTAIVWLGEDAGEAQIAARQNGREGIVLLTLRGGVSLSMAPEKIEDGKLVGHHPLFGPSTIPLDGIFELRTGDVADRTRQVAYADWKLMPAKEPQFADVSAMEGDKPFGTNSPLVGSAVEDFSIELLDGNWFRLEQHAGKVVVIDFWASWCGPCIQAMPELMEATGRFPEDDVMLLAVNWQETPQVVREFLQTRNWQMTVALDRDGALAKKFQVDALPQTVVIGPDGSIARLHVGAHKNLRDELTKVLKELVKNAEDTSQLNGNQESATEEHRDPDDD